MERKYPQRKRTKVTYTELEMSSREDSKMAKHSEAKITTENENYDNEQDMRTNLDKSQDEISEYEKLRLKNLEENRKIMMELGLVDTRKKDKENQLNLKEKKGNIKPKKVKPQKVTTITPTKRSLRLLKKTPNDKNMPLDVFQESPLNTPNASKIEGRTRIEEEELPMTKDGERTALWDRLKLALSESSTSSSAQPIDSLVDDMQSLQFAAIERINSSRVQSMCIHPMESNLLIFSGSKDGELGLWNVNFEEVTQYKPHIRALNCITTSSFNQSQLYTTSHDGTLRKADLNKSLFYLVYQTDEESSMCHITWHTEIDANNLLVAHGNGDAGVVDVRTKQVQQWINCHPRSVRTIQVHPTQPQYFLSASGTGECKIWDLRANEESVGELDPPRKAKGLTSAFFSPDGNKIATTCNDDYIRIHDSSDLANLKELQRVMHDNHTGRWLSVFKTVWHPVSSDLLFVGSMLHPRRIQMYNSSGRLMRELKDELLSTVVPVIAIHPSQPVVVGGNSTGKAHVFTTPYIIETQLNNTK